jgi:hypothetical protein
MRFCVTYGLELGQGGCPATELPLVVDIEAGHAVVSSTDDERRLDLVVAVPVDAMQLRLEEHSRVREGDGPELPAIDVPDWPAASLVARGVADAVAFIARCPTTLIGRLEPTPELLPDDEDDARILESLGTRLIYSPMTSTPSASMRLRLNGQNVALLCQRPSGIRLYADALKMGTRSGQFRELWRVLEAAFGAKHHELVDLLARCPAATEMEFDRDELHELLVLRGRASHASSRDDMQEVVRVEEAAQKVVGRVSGLAESLIVRKADWGKRTVGVDPTSPSYPYVRRNGTPVFYLSS